MNSNKPFPYLNVQLRLRVHVIKQLLVINILLIPLQGLIVAKVIS